MSQYAKDSNYNLTHIREGAIVGGFYTPPSDQVANTWYRLAPSGTGQKVSGDNRKLDIGTLRSDIRHSDILGWHLKVLTASYLDHFVVGGFDAATGYATIDPSQHGGNIETHISRLPSSYAFVLYPELLLPLVINYDSQASDHIIIGYVAEDVESPSDVVTLAELRAGHSLILPNTSIDKVFYSFAGVSGIANSQISWGEHRITT